MERYKKYFKKNEVTRYEKIFNKFSEELRLSDLMQNSGISDLTKKFKKDRSGKMGSESKSASLINLEVNRNLGWAEFTFRTRATPYPELKGKRKIKYQMTSKPSSWKLKNNPAKTYIMKIRVMEFFKWLKTSPEGITNKDIEDVLEVANVKLNCTCPAYNFQGMAYYLGNEFNAAIYKQSIAPTDKKSVNGKVIGWDSRHGKGNSLVCKHLSGLIANTKFYIPQMRQKVVNYLNNEQ